MKRTLTQIGYISGLMERRGRFCELEKADRGLEFSFTNRDMALFVQQITGGKLMRKQSHNNRNHTLLYISPKEGIGWMLTCWSLVSQPTKNRIEHAILCWKTRTNKGTFQHPASCHPDRPHHAKGLCDMCYKRMRKATPYINFKIGGYGS